MDVCVCMCALWGGLGALGGLGCTWGGLGALDSTGPEDWSYRSHSNHPSPAPPLYYLRIQRGWSHACPSLGRCRPVAGTGDTPHLEERGGGRKGWGGEGGGRKGWGGEGGGRKGWGGEGDGRKGWGGEGKW